MRAVAHLGHAGHGRRPLLRETLYGINVGVASKPRSALVSGTQRRRHHGLVRGRPYLLRMKPVGPVRPLPVPSSRIRWDLNPASASIRKAGQPPPDLPLDGKADEEMRTLHTGRCWARGRSATLLQGLRIQVKNQPRLDF